MRLWTTIMLLALVFGAISLSPMGRDVASAATHVHDSPLDTVTMAAAVPGIPSCPHDPTRFHYIVERAPDSSIACAYDHEHHDDPRVLDPVFGPLQYGEISYPWQTSSALGLENVVKHRVYTWATLVNAPCHPSNASKGFSNARLQAHTDGNRGATVRFHSFFLQAQACDPSDPNWNGTITTGGHMDYGNLTLLMPSGQEVHVPLPGDPLNSMGRRIHGSTNKSRTDSTWYGNYGLVSVGIRGEDWGPVDSTDPTRLLFYGGDLNGSWQEPFHVLALRIGPEHDLLDGVMDGRVTYNGFTNRSGTIVPPCSPVGPDCVPLQLNNMKTGSYQIRADSSGIPTREYDVKVNGTSLIQHPDTVANCGARPTVSVSTTPNGPGKLRATAVVNTDSGTQSNHMRSLRFGPTQNALIDIGSQVGASGTFTFAPPPYAKQIWFDIRAQSPGAVQVPVTVVDACGDWPSFVGGGESVFGSPTGSAPASASAAASSAGRSTARSDARGTTGQSPTPSPARSLPVAQATPAAGQACASFPNHAAAQAQLRANPTDPLNIDRNRNGIACEGGDGAGFVNPPLDHNPVPRP
jgi:hypothetical protein